MKSCYKCRLILISLLALAILPQGVLAYKPTTTHAGLSQEIADFYNLRFARKLTGLEKELLIKGSVDEDAPVTRVLNHFYDPVRNVGLFSVNPTSKRWALDTQLQDNRKHFAGAGVLLFEYFGGKADYS